jgi:hypothetical protein
METGRIALSHRERDRLKVLHEVKQKTKSNPNTRCLPSTLGEGHGSGHFYMTENRTFLLCVDIVPCARSSF